MLLKRTLFVIILTLSTLSILEGVARFSAKFAIQSEVNHEGYETDYNKTYTQEMLRYRPNSNFTWKNSEFEYYVKSNDLGFRDISHEKNYSGYRITVLGDSFTEGMGAPVDSSWVSIFRNLIMKNISDSISIMNCGISGSDPFFSYHFLVKELISYNPDFIILTINSTDIDDIIIRGGNERFKSDGSIKSKRGKWFLPIYAHSHLFRLVTHVFFNYNHLLMENEEYEKEREIAIEKLSEAIHKIDSVCNSRNIAFHLIELPLPDESLNKSNNPFKNLNTKLSHIKTLNLFNELSLNPENLKHYSWEIDRHYNGNGYALVAKEIYDDLKANIEDLAN